MDRPRLEACYFGAGPPGEMYARLAHVLDYTAHKHCPDWEINVQRLEPPEYRSAMGNPSHVWNTQKLQHWVERAVEAQDGARVLMIDGDMLIVRPIDDVWDLDFDLAYTIRQGNHLPLNGGVVFVRITDPVRVFLKTWWEVNLRFLGNAQEHRNWRLRFAGINQASFGFMLEKHRHTLNIRKLPCSEWNLCEWERGYDPKVTRIIHIKSGLRRGIFGVRPAPRLMGNLQMIGSLWKQADKEAEAWRNQRAEPSASTGTEVTPSMSASV